MSQIEKYPRHLMIHRALAWTAATSIVAACTAAPTPPASEALLSGIGLYADTRYETLAPGVLPYDVRFELWSDGATKARWLYLPEGTQIDTQDPAAWRFPVGTRAWKEFRVDGVRIETRMLHKTDEDHWEQVSYIWREDGSDADASPAGLIDANGTTHDVPDTAACNDCHRGGSDGLLGVTALQLTYDSASDPLHALEVAGKLSDALPQRPSIPGNEVEVAALGYLNANCGHCHSDRHPLSAARSIRFGLPNNLEQAAQAPALLTLRGAYMHHDFDGTRIGLDPGNPEGSQMWRRMQHRNDGIQMPARGSEVIDTAGLETIRAWIAAIR